MARGDWNGYVQNLCQMTYGWAVERDLEALERLRHGRLVFDLRARTCLFEGEPIELVVTTHLADWLAERVEHEGLDPAALDAATLAIDFDSKVDTWSRFSGVTDVQFTFRCSAAVTIEGRRFEARGQGTRISTHQNPFHRLGG